MERENGIERSVRAAAGLMRRRLIAPTLIGADLASGLVTPATLLTAPVIALAAIAIAIAIKLADRGRIFGDKR